MSTTTTMTKDDLLAMFSEAAVLVQGEDSYRIDCVVDDEIHVTHEDTGETFLLQYDDIDLSRDLVYGLTLLNKG